MRGVRLGRWVGGDAVLSGTTSLGFPYPTDPDPMCAAPVLLPPVTSVEALGDAVDAWVAANLAPDYARLADGFPRAKVSRTFFDSTVSDPALLSTFNTLDFNLNTPTDLAFNNTGVVLLAGTWLLVHEVTWTTTVQVAFGAVGGLSQDSGPVVQATNVGEPVLGGGQNFVELVRIGYPSLVTSPLLAIHTAGNSGTFVTYHALTAIQMADFF